MPDGSLAVPLLETSVQEVQAHHSMAEDSYQLDKICFTIEKVCMQPSKKGRHKSPRERLLEKMQVSISTTHEESSNMPPPPHTHTLLPGGWG